MLSKVADSIRRGLEEAVAYAEGTVDASRYSVHVPEDVKANCSRLIERDPKAVRNALRKPK